MTGFPDHFLPTDESRGAAETRRNLYQLDYIADALLSIFGANTVSHDAPSTILLPLHLRGSA